MNNKKGDTPMHAAPVEETEFIDMREQLAPKQVKAYAERRGASVEYNNGSILVRSKHPIDECLRRGILLDEHFESAKRVKTYRDCALSKLSGRTYNAPGEGDPEMDAGTVYAIVMRTMRRRDWELITLVCFTEPNIDGGYFTEAEYAVLLSLAPNIQHAFEASDTAFSEARDEVRRRIEEEKKRLAGTDTP